MVELEDVAAVLVDCAVVAVEGMIVEGMVVEDVVVEGVVVAAEVVSSIGGGGVLGFTVEEKKSSMTRPGGLSV